MIPLTEAIKMQVGQKAEVYPMMNLSWCAGYTCEHPITHILNKMH